MRRKKDKKITLLNALALEHQIIKQGLEERLNQKIVDKSEIETLCQFILNHLQEEKNLLAGLPTSHQAIQALVQESQLASQDTEQLIEMILEDHIPDFSAKEHLALLQLNLEQHIAAIEQHLFPELEPLVSNGQETVQLLQHMDRLSASPPDSRNNPKWYRRLLSTVR